MSKGELRELLNNQKGLSIIEVEAVARTLGINVEDIRERHMKSLFEELVTSVRDKLQVLPEYDDAGVAKAVEYMRRKVSV